MKLSSRPAFVCTVYFCLHLAAQLSARVFEIAPGISVWYPPCGLALSLLIMLGPAYAFVVLAANMAGALLVPGFPTWWAPIVFPAFITGNYTLIAWLVRRFLGKRLQLRTGRDALVFTGVLVAAPVGIAVSGTALIALLEPMTPGKFAVATAQWWLGDMAGLLTVVPVVMVFVAPWLDGKPHPAQRWQWNGRFLASVAVKTVALLGSVAFVFSEPRLLPDSTLYISFLPLIWICLRHGLPGATLATLGLIMGCLIGMHFTPQPPASPLLSTLLFGLTVAVLGLGLGSVVTRRTDVETKLTASRARFDRVIEGAQLGLWDWNVATGEVVYNFRCAELLRCPPAALARTREGWDHAIHPADRERNREALQAHLRGASRLYDSEYRIRTEDGHWRWIQSRGSVVQRADDGHPQLVSGTHVDITERKLTEAAAKRLLTIVETTTDFVLTIDPHGHIVYANQALLQLLGLPDLDRLRGDTFAAVFPPRSADQLQAEVIPGALARGTGHGELTLCDARQRELPISYVALVHGEGESETALLSFVMRDISAQKQAATATLEKERKILQVQRAESLSVLAGGIAHDFNNLLTAIFGNTAMLREDIAPGQRAHGPLGQIEIAATRAAELCKNMLAYAGRVHLTLAEVDLNALVTESRELVQAAINKKISLETFLAPRLPPIKGSASQLQQVIINLALNAHEAIGDRPGTITFRTSWRQLTGREIAEMFDAPFLAAGSYVLLEVEDTGCGMPPDMREKIFEPFFTTKAHGHGLGLAAVNGIVRAHGGAIHVQTAVDQGSTFRLLLPAIELAPANHATAPSGSDPWRGSGLALIVDDEDMVRAVVARLIERLGFTTITAADGAEAVEIFQQRHAELRFVLTDLTMPRLSGDEAMREMRRINPNVPVILMSGYPEKMTPDHFVLASPAALLAKPIRPDVLQKTVRQVLHEA